jgi:DNA polymerase-3 subunit gamma/tau
LAVAQRVRPATEPRSAERPPAPEPASPDRPHSVASGNPSALAIAPEPVTVSQTEAAPRDTARLPEASTPSQEIAPLPLDLATARKVWPDLFKKVGARLGLHLSQVEPVAVAAPDILVIAAKSGYNSVADECGTAESLAKIEQALQRLTHRSVSVKYERSPEVEDLAHDAGTVDARRTDAVSSDPMVQKVIELFEARSLQFEYDEPDPNQPT